MIRLVRKQSGHEEQFRISKLATSISSALRHADMDGKGLGNRIAHEAKEFLEGKGAGGTVGSSEIEQAVLHVLREEGMGKAATFYELVSLHLPSLRIKSVLKRGGGSELFHPQKLFKSIRKAFADSGLTGGKISEELTHKTIDILEAEHDGKPIPTREIKRTVAHLLKERGLNQVEKMYLVHKYL